MTGIDDRTATDPNKVDAIKLSLMLADLRLPTINQLWKSFAKRAAEGWTARPLPRSPRRARARRTRPKAYRTPSQGGQAAPRKEPRLLRLQGRADARKGPGHGARRPTAGSTRAPTASCSARPAPAKAILPPPGLALVENGYRVLFTRTTDLVQRLQVARTRARPRKPARKARPLPSSDPRRPRLRAKGSGRDKRSVRTHLGALRTALSSDHGEPVLRRMEQGVPRRRPLRWPPSIASSTTPQSSRCTSSRAIRRRTALDRRKRGPGRPAKIATEKNTTED